MPLTSTQEPLDRRFFATAHRIATVIRLGRGPQRFVRDLAPHRRSATVSTVFNGAPPAGPEPFEAQGSQGQAQGSQGSWREAQW
jgi:hypothetical protein